jgi:catechol 2,3-dioxygenase-like lactoylglutathione lyase family enzyme
MARLNYVELPVRDTASSKAFYEAVFGFVFTDYGPSYAATTSGDVDLGLQGDSSEWTAALLPVIQVVDLDATFDQGSGRPRIRRDGTRHRRVTTARLPRYRSSNRGISSTKLQGRWRMSSWLARMSSHPSFTAPVEPGSAKM